VDSRFPGSPPHHFDASRSVHGEKTDSGQVSSSRNCTRYGVRNVVEFQIEEDIKTKARELLNGARAFGGEKLAPDFENPRDPSELAGQINCRSKMFKIQSDDKSPAAGGDQSARSEARGREGTSRSSSRTFASPCWSNPSRRATSYETSNSRPSTYGPRSLIRTTWLR
jgi:hypothetical protein